MLLLSLLMIRAVFGVDADFESLISRMALDDSPIPDHIPNVVHFVFVTITPIGWSEYVAVRSAAVNLKAEIINIWVPMEADFIGNMWGRVLEIPGVVLRRTEMPDSVYGHKAVALAHRSDFARLKALYSEGGKSAVERDSSSETKIRRHLYGYELDSVTFMGSNHFQCVYSQHRPGIRTRYRSVQCHDYVETSRAIFEALVEDLQNIS